MRTVPRWFNRLLLPFGAQSDQTIADEIQSHVALHADELIAAGQSPDGFHFLRMPKLFFEVSSFVGRHRQRDQVGDGGGEVFFFECPLSRRIELLMRYDTHDVAV